MKTIVVQIGNTDNKLTQKQWAEYCKDMYQSVELIAEEIHFSAPSVGWAEWQNATFVFTLDPTFVLPLKSQVATVRRRYLQDSVAWLEGITEFI